MLKDLCNEFWILREKDKEKYFKTKDNLPEIRSFINDKLGYKLVIKPEVIKLEKVPVKAEKWMGISDFKRIRTYIFFVMLLMFLEKREKYFQFILSDLTSYITENYEGKEIIKWENYWNRADIIQVLRFAEKMGIIKIEEFEESKFRNSEKGEALCTNTGLSRYFMRYFEEDISDYKSIEDFEKSLDIYEDIDRKVPRLIRNRAYSELFLNPAVYRKEFPEELTYLKKQAANIVYKEVEKYLGATLHIHKNAAFVVYDIEQTAKNSIYGQGISEIILQLNSIICEKVKTGEFKYDDYDIVTISTIQFAELVRELKDEFSYGWYKNYREGMTVRKLEKEIKEFMLDNKLIYEDIENNNILILPLVSKKIGQYENGIQEGVEN